MLKKHDAKISDIENKIPSIIDLASNSALTAVENKIPDVRNLVKNKTKQIMIQELVKLKRKSLIIIMINLLLLQNLIRLQQKFLLQD